MKSLLFLLTVWTLPLWSQTAFEEARTAYDRGDFQAALELYASIPGQSAALDYNIGNTLMRLGNVTEAVAYYRRAQWQDAGDPDIRANLEHAAELSGSPVPPLPLSRRLSGFLDAGQWQLAFLISCWLCAIPGIASLKFKSLRSVAAWGFPLAGILILICAGGLWASLPSRYFHEAVIRQDEVTARFGPLSDATEHFSLPGGTMVELVERSRDWYRIRAAEKQGWVPAGALWILKELGN